MTRHYLGEIKGEGPLTRGVRIGSHRPTPRSPKNVRILPPISERLIRSRSPRPHSAKTYENPAHGTACRNTCECPVGGVNYRSIDGVSGKGLSFPESQGWF